MMSVRHGAAAVALRRFRDGGLRVIDTKSADRFLYLSFVGIAGDEAAPDTEASFVQTIELDCVTEKRRSRT